MTQVSEHVQLQRLPDLFAIDAAHSCDLDDAVAVTRTADGWIVHVAVALVARVVPAGSPLDRTGRARAFSRYSRGCVRLPMLPRHLSEGRLSLSPDAPRDVMLVTLDLCKDLKVRNLRYDVCTIPRVRRATFEAVQAAVMDTGHVDHAVFVAMWELASGLLERRRRRGALAVHDVNSNLVTDEEGNAVLLDHADAHKGYIVVQELMILANGALAAHCVQAGIPVLFRNHRARPAADRGALRQDLDLAARSDDYLAFAMGRLALMLEKAEIGATCQGHYGLSLPAYAWFTSPLRRYADLVNQRALLRMLEGDAVPPEDSDLPGLADRLNAEAKAAADGTSEFLKDQAAERAQRQMTSRKLLQRATDTEFSRIVAEACKAAAMTGDLADEAVRRINDGRVGPKELTRLIVAGGEPEACAIVREAVAARLTEMPWQATQMLHYMRQTMGLGDLLLDACPVGLFWRGRGFASWRETAHCVEAAVLVPSRREALQQAACRLLAELTGVMVDLAQRRPEEPQAAPAAPPALLPPDAVDLDRVRNVLQELCQKNGWPLPVFETSASGPSHQPVFTATCTVTMAGRVVTSPPVTGASKKEAEKRAAAAMLEVLRNTILAAA